MDETTATKVESKERSDTQENSSLELNRLLYGQGYESLIDRYCSTANRYRAITLMLVLLVGSSLIWIEQSSLMYIFVSCMLVAITYSVYHERENRQLHRQQPDCFGDAEQVRETFASKHRSKRLIVLLALLAGVLTATLAQGFYWGAGLALLLFLATYNDQISYKTGSR